MNDLATAQGIVRFRLTSLLTDLQSQSANQSHASTVRGYLTSLNDLIAYHIEEPPDESESTDLLNKTLEKLGSVQVHNVKQTIDGAYQVLTIMSALPGKRTTRPRKKTPPKLPPAPKLV